MVTHTVVTSSTKLKKRETILPSQNDGDEYCWRTKRERFILDPYTKEPFKLNNELTEVIGTQLQTCLNGFLRLAMLQLQVTSSLVIRETSHHLFTIKGSTIKLMTKIGLKSEKLVKLSTYWVTTNYS